ncbi:hypothetical protein [Mycoplasma suis]|nr:hypothetical protein [Mycoplasma suis]
MFSWFFWMSSQNNLNWTHSSLNGLYTKVRLFFEIPSSQSKQTASSSASFNSQQSLSNLYNIQQVNQEPVTQSETIKSMTVEIPLKYLGRTNYYRYCLNTKQEQDLTTSSVSQVSNSDSSGTQDCNLNYFYGNSEKDKKVDVGFFLHLLTKWIKLQHAINMLFLFEEEGPEHLRPSSSNDRSLHEKLSKACNFSAKNNFSALTRLFSSPFSDSKSCLLSPSVLNVRLKTSVASQSSVTSEVQNSNTTSQEINESTFKEGTIEGNYIYSLYDYSANPKKVNLENSGHSHSSGQEKELSFEIKTFPIELKKENSSQENQKCNFDSLYKKYEDRNLKPEELVSSCLGKI